jgi:hypothetical protein
MSLAALTKAAAPAASSRRQSVRLLRRHPAPERARTTNIAGTDETLETPTAITTVRKILTGTKLTLRFSDGLCKVGTPLDW